MKSMADRAELVCRFERRASTWALPSAPFQCRRLLIAVTPWANRLPSLFFTLGSNAIPMTLNTRHTSLRRSSSLEGLGVRGWEGRWMAHDPSDRTQEGARRHVGSHASPSRPSAAAPQHASRATDCRPLAHAPTWIAPLAAAVEGRRSARAAGSPGKAATALRPSARRLVARQPHCGGALYECAACTAAPCWQPVHS